MRTISTEDTIKLLEYCRRIDDCSAIKRSMYDNAIEKLKNYKKLEAEKQALEKQLNNDEGDTFSSACVYKYSCGYDYCMDENCPDFQQKKPDEPYVGKEADKR